MCNLRMTKFCVLLWVGIISFGSAYAIPMYQHVQNFSSSLHNDLEILKRTAKASYLDSGSVFYDVQLLTVKNLDPSLHPLLTIYRIKAKLALGQSKLESDDLRYLKKKTTSPILKREKYRALANYMWKSKKYDQFRRYFSKSIKEVGSRIRDDFNIEEIFNLAIQSNPTTRLHLHDVVEAWASDFPYSKDSAKGFYFLQKFEEHGFSLSKKILAKLARSTSLDTGLRQWFLYRLELPVRAKNSWRTSTMGSEEIVQMLLTARNYDAAESKIKSVIRSFDSSSKETEKLLRLKISTFFRKGNFTDALKVSLKFLEYFPHSKKRVEVEELVADSLRYLRKYKQANKIYQTIGKKTRSRMQRKQAKFMGFWSSFNLLKRLVTPVKSQEVAKLLNRAEMRDSDPLKAFRGYWEMRKEKISGKSDLKAKAGDYLKRFPEMTYSQWVYNNYGSEVLSHRKYEPRQFRLSDLEESGKKLFKTYSLIHKVWPEGAQLAFHLNYSTHKKSQKKHVLSRIASAINLYDHAYYGFEIGDENRYGYLQSVLHQVRNPKNFHKRYPKAYQDYVVSSSQYFSIPASLVWAIMRSESHYRNAARSQVGAIGLMQIMPYSFVRVAYQLEQTKVDEQTLADPALNIFYGSAYLSYLADLFQGSLPATIAAYNAGPKKVSEWLKRCPECMADEFIETIPYRETRRYVKKSLHAYVRYQRLYRDTLLPAYSMKLPSDLSSSAAAF